MSETEERLRQYLKRVTVDLGKTRQRLREVEERSQEPLAVVGMACRFPGDVRSPEDLWTLVDSGADAVGEFPSGRGWDLDRLYDPDPDTPGTSYAREGGFLYDADRFDAAFFDISPREALAMEPQQRVLLELSWELLERAGIDPRSLKGSATGVYAGAGLPGFGGPRIAENIEGHLLTGNALSVLSGRVAFALGLEGPALSVDTACSSSLVALHLAAQALRQGECSLAVAGGVTVMATPYMFSEFSRQRGLAPDGRCKPFAEAADGTGFAEGAGLLLLERLSDARRNGHRVHAVIRGSAVNQDGASNGLTAPKGPSQERVIRQALANAGLSASEVDAVEAHGTGTTLGDPIEAQALLATYGKDRPADRPLWLGSVKSNIGHTQGAAGVAGVIKMVMAMRHGRLPATLHVDRPSTRIDWSAGTIRLLTGPADWPRRESPRRAGVSAFGMSGTNAHVILEESPEPEPALEPVSAPGVVPWVLSARGEEALRAQAAALAAWPAQDPVTEVGYSLATTRTAFEDRAVVIGSDREELLTGVRALATGGGSASLVRSPAGEPVHGDTVFLFSGQGSQRAGMGAGLYERFPVFAEAFDEVCGHLDPHLEYPLRRVVFDGDPKVLDHTTYAQTGLFALQIALVRLVESFGVRPDVVIGHSIGEIAAAHVAGVFDLPDACRLVAARATLMGGLPEGGAMTAIEASAEELTDLPETVSIAALNTATSTVISGPAAEVARLTAAWKERGRKTKALTVSHAFHSALMDPILGDFQDAIGDITYRLPAIPLISNLTGEPADERITTPGYWAEQIRWPVRFHPAMAAATAKVFLELGPDPVLAATADQAPAVSALSAKHPDERAFAHALATLHTTGTDIDWTPWYPGDPAPRTVPLPTYAFQRRRYWIEGQAGTGDAASLGLDAAGHPLLSAVMELADEGVHVLSGRITGAASGGWLADHQVMGTVLVPGAALVEWALRAADEAGCRTVEELVLQAPLVVPESEGVRVQVVIEAAGPDGRRGVRVHSRADRDDGTGWTCHATGVLGPETAAGAGEPAGAWPPAGARPVDASTLYERTAAAGYGYGPAFQGVRALWRDGADLLAEVVLPEAAGEPGGFGIHPALLDAALHPGLLTGEAEDGTVLLPFAWNGVELHAEEATAVRVRLTPSPSGPGGERELRVQVSDTAGAPVLTVDSVTLRPAGADGIRPAGGRGTQGLFALGWTPLADDTGAAPGSGDWAALGPDPVGAAAVSHQDLDALVAALDDGAAVPPVVTAMLPAGDGERSTVEAALTLVQGWLAEPRLAGSRLVVVTREAVASTAPDPAGAAVWGLLRSVQSEEPDRFVLVDLDADGDPAEAVRRAVATGEPQVAARAGRLRVPRLAPASAPDGDRPALDPKGTVLITGGTGMAGGVLAEHLVRTWGVRHLLLASRQGPEAPGAEELAGRLRELGAEVRVAAADVADPAAVRDLVGSVDPARPLTGVVHAAGLLDDAMVTATSPERLARVWAAKADGAAHLHAATADLPIALFVLFSSAASCTGNPGQAAYAAANAYCDALAARRRAAGLPGTSVAWGLWADAGGMAGNLTETGLARLRRSGGAPLTGEQAMELLDEACRHADPYLCAVNLDPRVLAAQPAGALAPPLRALGRAGRERTRRVAAGGTDGSGLAARLASLDEDGRLDAVLAVVGSCVAGVLGHGSTEEIRDQASFKDLGFDSLTAVELRNRLAAATGLRLPTTLVFDHPNPRSLARHLCTRLTGQDTTAGTPVTATAGTDEPIAIVAMACRYPGGVRSPEDLWDLVASGRDAIGEFPGDRGWDLAGLFHPDPDHPGTSYADRGGFLEDAAGFDAGFFGISPREALAMDPQQRLLLEVSWETLERAGIDPVSLRGSRTGVYAGVMYHDYAAGLARGDAQLQGYAMMAGQGSVVPGRVAYTLGLEGPAVTVDTACSSSLVAMHLAAQALRQGECSLALAGGVTVLATPDVFTSFSRQRGLSPDGRCKSYAASADGTGWGEGAGLLLLERLSDARRNGHPVLAVLRGSAVNQDGASNGLTAPNGPSQERVIRQALANARMSPGDVDAVEGHGTGTTLGDPIEAQALLATYGKDRDRPLWLGSVKSNIGHTQAAAGAAGVIKMVMAMRHGTLPVTLHVDEPSPHVDWDAGAVRLLTDPVDWPEAGRPRCAGVSSFGVSGTNAHVILERPPEPPEAPEPPTDHGDGVTPWVLSAHDDEALRGQAAALAGHVAGGAATPVEVAWSLVASRTVFDRRAVVLGADRDDLLAGLRALAAGETHPGVILPATAVPGGTVFLFSGQGSQRAGMGAGLYERFPVFAAAVEEICDLLDPLLPHPLRPVVFTGEPDLLDHTTYAQAGLFTLHVALARLLASLGVEPDVVIGHSIGEIAAAHLAGVFDLPDACRLVAARATLMGRLPEGGAMAAIQATAGELAEDGVGTDGPVALAAVNTPDGAVVSGPAGEVARITAAWAERGRKTKALTVSHAFHSSLMDPILEEFTEAVGDLTFHPPRLPVISNLSGRPAGDEITTPGYWAEHIRRPVLFAPAITHVAPQAGVFLELGPDPVLATAAQQTLDHLEAAGEDEERPAPLVLSALNGRQPDDQALARTLARLRTAGRPVDWRGWFPAGPRPRTVPLPTYAFRHEHYWLASASGVGDLGAAGLRRVEHGLLPAAVGLAGGGLLLTGRAGTAGDGAWLADHRMAGALPVPGAALVEWALRAADETGCGGVEELVLQAPLVLPESGTVGIQVVAGPAGDDGRREVTVHSRPGDDAPWTCHAVGTLLPETAAPPDRAEAEWPPPGAEPVDLDGFYERNAAAGYEYGPAFRGLRAAWRDGADVLAEVELPEAAGEPGGFGIHPALLDAALQSALLAADPGGDGKVWLPFAWNGVSLWASGATTVRVRLAPADGDDPGERGVRMSLADVTGAPVLTADSVVMRPADAGRLAAAANREADGRLLLDWTALPDTEPEPHDDAWAVLGEDGLGLGVPCHAGFGELRAAIEDGAPAVVLAPVATASGDADAGLSATEETLALAQAWLAEPRLAGARLVMVTRAAALAGEHDRVDPAAAAVWGLVRSAQIEHPGRFFLLDLDDAADPDAVRRAVRSGEPQTAVRGERLLVPRLAPPRDAGLRPPREGAWRLGLETPGTVENVAVTACPEVLEPLGPGQVRVSVRAAGVNFRDVLIALGMYPAGGVFRGSEGAGVVLDVGPGVTGVAAGDRVMGLFEGAFGPVAVADARTVVPVPDGWGWREAAAVPVVFATAWLGLRELAGLRAGESVLIHAATGGVGTAAVQIARYLGAEVYATASPGKHAVLEEMGVDEDHRASSRDLEFEAKFRKATGGRGVDVVLNSLAGEFVDASLRLLAEGGRFLEMGKTDLRDPERVAEAHPGVTYEAFDLMSEEGSAERNGRMLTRLATLFADGTLRPAPVRAWPVTRAREALRHLSQARHVGKLVLDMPARIDPRGTVLITGGTGALGGLVAEHLVREWGAGHLLLAGRRGPDAPGAKELAERLTALGAEVRIEAADVADAGAVNALITGLDRPLTGVVHAAGVLDDGVLEALTPERTRPVWRAKALAAEHLHRATADADLGLFVVFSSSAATLGNPGQGNYAAANAFCDALAARRQAAGLPGVSIGWGLWARTSGMTGHLDEDKLARMARSGMRPLADDRALELFDAACRDGDAQPLAADLDVRALATTPADGLPAVLRTLAAGAGGRRVRRAAATVSARPEDWAGRLAGLSPAERHRTLLTLVRGHVATVLGLPDPEAVSADASFKDLGFDSLTAVELRNRLGATTGLRLPPALIFDYPHADALAGYLRERIRPDETAAPEPAGIEPLLGELARLESALSVAELDESDSGAVTARLEGLLAQWKAARSPEQEAASAASLRTASADQLLDFIDNELEAS